MDRQLHASGTGSGRPASTFVIGETGDIIARPEHPLLALAALALLAVAALVLARLCRGERERAPRRGDPAGAGRGHASAIPLALGLLAPSKDFVLARNLMPALVPLLVAVAIGFTLRGARRLGAVLGAALVAYSLGFSIWASVSPALQRPDWDAVAAAIGEPTAPRAMVTWTLGEASLRYYLSTGVDPGAARRRLRLAGRRSRLHLRRPGAAAAGRVCSAPASARPATSRSGRLYVRRYATAGSGPGAAAAAAMRAPTGFRTNGVSDGSASDGALSSSRCVRSIGAPASLICWHTPLDRRVILSRPQESSEEKA